MRRALSTAALAMASLACGLLIGCTGSQHSGGVYIHDLTVYSGGLPGQGATLAPAAPIAPDPHDDHPVVLALPNPLAPARTVARTDSPVTLSFDTSNAGGNARGSDSVSPSTTATLTGPLPGGGG